ncbi:MAG: HEAT repeat domain-containing protein [Verrucomicrobiota bacterium]
MLWNEIRKLKSKNWESRRQAAKNLGASKSSRAVKALAEALKDRSVQVRETAIASLGNIATPDTIEPLAAMLVDEKLWVREEAAQALERALPNWPKSPAAKRMLPRLIEALKSADADISAAAQSTLGEIGDASAVEPLLLSLKRKGDAVVIEALGKIADHRAVPPLVALLKDPRPWIQQAVMTALDRIDILWPLGPAAGRAAPDLIAALRDNNILVRVSAARALARLNDPAALEPLIAALADGGYIAQAAENALSRINPDWRRTEAARRAAASFAKGLKSPEGDVRFTAARELGRLGGGAYTRPLVEALVDEQARVRTAALQALEALDPTWPTTKPAKDAVACLIQALKHPSTEVQRAAAETLARICDPAALDALLESLQRSNLAAAAQALGNLRDPRALEPLVHSLLNKSLFVRLSIERALCNIDLDWFNSKPARSAVPMFLKAFRENADRELRRAAAEALGKIGDARAIPILTQGHRDEDAEVAQAADEALKRIRSFGASGRRPA